MLVRRGPLDDIIARDADGIYLIYHRPSGDTHVLAPELLIILDALGDRFVGVDELIEKLSADYELATDDGDLHSVVQARLCELVTLGLADVA
jgi:PqqD family protein of HPr-rel-A system